ncbi:hypothetical protein Lalb_Chr13g0293981 [Lupinus albus]|uniref:Uncharacterized protein n=1 Tax=Lupinus albus TaxID=3870 RepID=A0A6A4PHP1_LUPAL|nr:hypothetical protein Lalb_Chr13g0293981 [Lupinus albus]
MFLLNFCYFFRSFQKSRCGNSSMTPNSSRLFFHKHILISFIRFFTTIFN